eukprot:TRINITY_DN20908_c0_g1_i1.p1 TRINITY_DN20908_c0_g1~~TRINITY_DN20908_c0_g1_i1.p1  ORF type:complete len:359 (+),score=61.22 TRINITY_DN20908_c0_g1_i1:98-1078(+)
MAPDDNLLIQKLQDLQKQLGKKNVFEDAVSSITSLMRETYPSASPSVRKSIYSLVCRVATILQTRYTAPGFWFVGLRLFEEAEGMVTVVSEREHLKLCIARAREHLHESENQPEVPESSQSSRFLFEGHLTVGPEPPAPAWLVADRALTALAATRALNAIAEPPVQGQNNNTSEHATEVAVFLEELLNGMGESGFEHLSSAIEASMQEHGSGSQIPPPASKEVVAKLPIINVTDEIVARLGSDIQCPVCTETLVIDDKMQELPCKHVFHPDCLKPWLDEHNSCPICRHELQTDDHAYESRKERQKEEEEDRKGAANAVRGGEYMYV